MASREEIDRARKVTFADSAGRRRERTGAQARALAPKARAKAAKRKRDLAELRDAFRPRDPIKRAGRLEKVLKKRGSRKRVTYRGSGVQAPGRGKRGKRKGTPGDRAVQRSLEDLFGITLRDSGDFASLIEAESADNTVGRVEFTIADPVGDSGDMTVYEESRKAAHELMTPELRREGKVFALTIVVSVGRREIASEAVTVRPDSSQVVGAMVKTIMQALGVAGYYASDGDAGNELREQGGKRARNVHVEVTAVRLGGK